MYKQLYQYLIQYKNLSVPGIGTFLLERHSAVAHFAERVIQPPTVGVAFSAAAGPISTEFYKNLAAIIGCSEREAVIRFNDFCFAFKNNLNAGDRIDWAGVGIITKEGDGNLSFSSAIPLIKEQPVMAEKVIRENAAHTVRVGEEEKSSDEMTAFYNQSSPKKSYWWVSAVILGLLSITFLGWHLSTKGMQALGNQQRLQLPVTIESSYSILE
ncbi:MAG: hypothetical protein RIR12_80 [Bacteroidota bacterium]|jgi:hypothetical protein